MRTPLFLVLIFSAASLYAQQTHILVRGKLIDQVSKSPVPYASVYLKGKGIGTATNDEGRFSFHVPSEFSSDTLIISFIGYETFKSVVYLLSGEERVIELKPGNTLLNEVTVTAKKELTGKEIVKKAAARIQENYPMKPFMIEGFFRDLQKEDGKPVALLEAATRFYYKDYNPGYEDVEILEVRKSFNKRHPVNGTYDRQNSIFDLMEDNYVKHRFGPVSVKGWKFVVDSIISYNQRTVYQISGVRSASESVVMHIDSDNFAFLKIDYKTQMVNGQYYRRYLNLPDPYGQQQTSFRMIFEFQEIDGKQYLKYQREEDTYNLFNKTTQEIIIKQAYVKELFVNNIMTTNVDTAASQMNINKSVEGQAKPFNAQFWEHYNAPVETAADSKVVQQLQELTNKKQ